MMKGNWCQLQFTWLQEGPEENGLCSAQPEWKSSSNATCTGDPMANGSQPGVWCQCTLHTAPKTLHRKHILLRQQSQSMLR
jgi:hypothetical protein